MQVEVCKRGRQVTLQGNEAGEIIGREQIPLQLAEDNLDLIEPARVLGQPVQAHLKGQFQRRAPGPELLGGVGGSVVEDQMKDFAPRTERTLKGGEQEGFEIDKFLRRAALNEGLPAGHEQRTKELQRARPFIAIGHLQDFPRGRRFRGVTRWRA